jgi:hypothetical protein
VSRRHTPALPEYPQRLIDLGGALWTLYRQEPWDEVLTELREVFRRTSAALPEGHPRRGCALPNVAVTLGMQFGGSADLVLLREIVDLHRQAVRATPAEERRDRLEHLRRFRDALQTLYARVLLQRFQRLRSSR